MRLFLAGLLLALVGCGGDATEPRTSPIGPSGGTVTGADGKVTLQIPSGALSKEQVVSIRALSSSETGTAPGALPGTAFALEPVGLTLATSASLSILPTLTATAAVLFEELVIARPGGTLGEELATTVSLSSRTVSVSIDRLGIVWVRAARVARIAFAPVSPSVSPGASVQLSASALAADGRVLRRDIAWTVRSPGVATIAGTGLLRALQPGNTWVVAQSEEVRDSVLVRVDLPVAALTISPSTATLLTGDSLVIQAVARDAQGNVVADAPVSWQTSDSTIASISSSGVVISRRTGEVSIVARVQQTSASATLKVIDAVAIDRISDANGNPAQLTALSGSVLIDLRTASALPPGRALAVEVSCASLSVTMLAPPPDATGLSRVRFPTDSIDAASGRALLINGPCIVTAQRTSSQGASRKSPAVSVTLSNRSSFSARFTLSGANSPFGAPFPVAVTSVNGTAWQTGSVALQLQARNFDSRQAVTSVNGSFLGKSFTLTTAESNGRFVIDFPNTANDPNGRGVSGFVSPAGGSQPSITGATFADGSAAFALLEPSNALFLDNEPPRPAARFALSPADASLGWVAGAFQFASATVFTSAGDGGGVGGQTVATYAAPASSVTPLPDGNAAGAACSIVGLRAAPSGADALRALTDPSAVGRGSILVRAFEADRLGNVRCTDLTSGPLGVDVVPPTLTRAASSTPDRTIFGYAQVKYPIRFDVVASDAHSGLPNPKKVTRRIVAYMGSRQNFCAIGSFDAGSCGFGAWYDTVGMSLNTSAHWRDEVIAIDNVGNQSAMLVTDVIDAIDDRPNVVSWFGFPNPFIGGSTFSLTLDAASGLGLYRVGLIVDYSYARANMRIEVAADTLGDRWSLSKFTRWQSQVMIRNFMRQLQIVSASNAPYDDAGEYSRAYGIGSFAENIGETPIGPFYGLGDKNMPLGYTYFGKGIREWRVNTSASSVSNGGSSNATVGLSAVLTLDAAVATPFSSVCFYYSQADVGGSGRWRPAGCSLSPTTTTSGATRTLEYRVIADPPTALGISGAFAIRAIGQNSTGDGLATNTSSAVTLAP